MNMKQTEALRDFFLARNGADLKRAFDVLAENDPGKAPDVPGWTDAEFAFNRLFVGPAALEAAPFASAYLEPESLVMGKTTRKVRSFYTALGLESPWKNSLPDDHVSLELDAALALKHAADKVGSTEVSELQAWFYDHLQSWMPQFIESVKGAPSAHPAITFAAESLSSWLEGLVHDKLQQ